MPESSRRHQRRAEAARARDQANADARAQTRSNSSLDPRRRLIVRVAAFAAIAIVGGVFWFTPLQPALPQAPSASAPASPGANVTPVALPTFGADAQTNNLSDNAPPAIATPTA